MVETLFGPKRRQRSIAVVLTVILRTHALDLRVMQAYEALTAHRRMLQSKPALKALTKEVWQLRSEDPRRHSGGPMDVLFRAAEEMGYR